MAKVARNHCWGLLVTRNFPPLVGGMEQVNLRLAMALSRGQHVAIAGPEGCASFAPAGASVLESPLRPLPRFLIGLLASAWRLARRHRPDVVIAGSGLSAPMAWIAARSCGAKLVVYLHGLDVIAPHALYRLAWLPFIRACDVVLANSRHTAGLAASRGVDSRRVVILNPGTTIPVLDPHTAAVFLAKHGLEGRRVLLSVGRLTQRKGLAEFVIRALPVIVAHEPEAVLVIIGGDATDALHGDGSQRGRIEAAVAATGQQSHVRFLGHCDDATLAAAYQAAACHVFPVLEVEGDVEGFGMVALESAAHGLRTVTFAVGGVPDAVAPGETGFLIPAGDYEGFAHAVLAVMEGEGGTPASLRGFAATKAWDRFDERFIRAIGLA